MKVLIVDDEPRVLRLTTALLARRGFQPVEAGDALSALVKAREFDGNLDALITDVDMPGMNGIDLAKALSSEFPSLPILFISGHGTPEGLEQLPDAVFLPKPFQSAELLKALENAVHRRGS